MRLSALITGLLNYLEGKVEIRVNEKRRTLHLYERKFRCEIKVLVSSGSKTKYYEG